MYKILVLIAYKDNIRFTLCAFNIYSLTKCEDMGNKIVTNKSESLEMSTNRFSNINHIIKTRKIIK